MKTFNPLKSLPEQHIKKLREIHQSGENTHRRMVDYIEDNCMKGVLFEQGLDHEYYAYALEFVFQGWLNKR